MSVHHGRNGYRYPPGAPDVLAGHLGRLPACSDEMGRAGRRSPEIVGGHTLDATSADFEDVHTRVGSRLLKGHSASARTEVTAW